MRDDGVASQESDVADLDWSRLAVLGPNVGVLAAPHREEDGAAQEVGPRAGPFMEGHAKAVAEDDGGHSFLVLLGWVEALVAGCLAADVLVDLASAV